MITKSQVKYIQSLGQKKFRDEEAVFIAEGPKIINELLGGIPSRLVVLYATTSWLDANASLLKQIAAENVTAVKEVDLERLSFLPAPNQVIAAFKKPVYSTAIQLAGKISLMLDGIQDPGNMGTIIRTADWFGITQIICSMDCADAFAPKVVQSTVGSIIRVRLLYTDLVQWQKENARAALYAAALNGKNICDMKSLEEGIIVIGNESKGIHKELLDRCNEKLTIRGFGKAESLNAAVATGIILSHLIRP
jgi:RNA methyltransferase, TrmH family